MKRQKFELVLTDGIHRNETQIKSTTTRLNVRAFMTCTDIRVQLCQEITTDFSTK